MTPDPHEKFMRRAIELAQKGIDENRGGPFGCVVVKDGEIVGEGCNEVTSSNDPTAHAEVVAVREACRNLNSFQLDGCTIYTSCEPCPMCLGAIYWARPEEIFVAGTRDDAAAAGFDDELFYSEIEKPNDDRQLKMQWLLRDESQTVFKRWVEKADKVEY
ncbi:MAG TPA: nucleoside deaminase [Pyrinomonadaceae bacterium]|nr:nucleoside deaminase [Pyrinomonadaceae bacterium]